MSQILYRWNWRLNDEYKSPIYTLKWTYLPTLNDFNLQEGQIINHFKGTHEITSKSYLSKNLKAYPQNCEAFFPKCYDIGKKD